MPEMSSQFLSSEHLCEPKTWLLPSGAERVAVNIDVFEAI